jgi:hypothetical protein
LSAYTPDFLPLSIGTQSQHLDGRLTAHYVTNPGLLCGRLDGVPRRADVTLDRPYYYTDGQISSPTR